MIYIMCLMIGTLLPGLAAMASDSVCASVNIEVNQELTLEREGFDAHMRINNGLENITLNNVGIAVKFTDADGLPVVATSDQENTNAQFYIAVDSMSGISDVSGNGSISPATSADIHWLIIPNPGAGGDSPQGVLYYVGATLSYRIGETSNVTEVVPDYIYVRPMPNLALDYFLPMQVYGDDAFTGEVEPSVPFVLGLRVKNIGYGIARNFKLDSGQPLIVANASGLLVAFVLEQTEVNGVLRANSLLVDFGNITPGASASANWIMTCSLSGTFTNFSASFSHSDELGGQLTSLIQPENLKTHRLIKDVLVDLANRDQVRDYLTDEVIIYESEGIDSVVTNLSAGAQLSPSGADYVLTLPAPEAGFIYVVLTNPVGTNLALESVARSDGKSIKEANAWISKQRKANPEEGWNYYFNLFDANPSNNTYTVRFTAATNINHEPVLIIPNTATTYPGENLVVKAQATDQDGITPALDTGNLPIGAHFLDKGNGDGVFSWTPAASQLGEYWVRFTASDLIATNAKSVLITVASNPNGAIPGWWQRRQVIMGLPAVLNDYAVVNQGQVKHIVRSAWEELETLPGGAGFTPMLTTNVGNYAAANLGQLKQAAKPFYDRLYMTNYPWLGASVTNDYAIANIGQVKNLFSFNPGKDSDGDGMPDWWETKHGLNPTNTADAAADSDSDGLINRGEYLRNTDPLVSD